MVLPLIIAAAGGGTAVGGALLSDRAARKEAKYKQEVKDRWMQRRRTLAKALGDNYWSEGQSQQGGMSNQMQALGDGSALARVQGAIPDQVVAAPEAGDNLDPAFRAAFARRAAVDTGVTNNGLALNTAASRRARFGKALDNQAWLSNSASRFRSPEFRRARFLNAMEAAQADADFQREFGDTPNSARNMALAGSIMQTIGSSGIKAAGMM